MTLLPGTHLWENVSGIWTHGVNGNRPAFGLMLLNSTLFPLRTLFFWLIFITLMLPVEVRIFPTVQVIADRHFSVPPVFYVTAG